MKAGIYSSEYFNQFEKNLTQTLLRQLTNLGLLEGKLFEAPELDEKFDEIAPEYMADAVPEIPHYPMVAIAWAGYLGLALAHYWDKDWERYHAVKDLYQQLRAPRGFDAMDEYIIEEVLGLRLDSAIYQQIEQALQSVAERSLSLIRQENFNPQTTDAFYIYSRTVKVVYKMGVAMEMKRLGYRYEKAKLN